jgi:hypothetical protein
MTQSNYLNLAGLQHNINQAIDDIDSILRVINKEVAQTTHKNGKS